MAHQAKTRIVAKDPVEKLARQRMSVLQLAVALGSVSAACRRAGIGRTSFYDWKRRFQTQGPDGLKDPPVHKTHPMATPPEVVERVLALSEANSTPPMSPDIGSCGDGSAACCG